LDTLIDDAAIFPPGNAALPDALAAHCEHTESWYGALVGPFLVSDVRLSELTGLLQSGDAYATDSHMPCAVVVTGGAGALGPVVTAAQRCDRLALHGLEIAVREEDELARNVRRISVMLADELPDGVPVSVELPRSESAQWAEAADAVAASGFRFKFRTGGETGDAHPDPVELAADIIAAVDREAAFKCTAGLHHAVRTTALGTGLEEHGFLNVMLATRAVLDGASDDDVVRILAERDPETIASACSQMPSEQAARVRRWFTSFGSCSIDEPVSELIQLGLLTADVERGVERGVEPGGGPGVEP